jgi:hypothetical protein
LSAAVWRRASDADGLTLPFAPFALAGSHAPVTGRVVRNDCRLSPVCVCYGAVELFSGNHFDGSVEASMTAALVIGPMGAIIGLVTGAILGKRKPVTVDVPPRRQRR